MKWRFVIVGIICLMLGAGAYAPAALAAPPPGLELSELLVDPVSPQTDAQDEYIELYNAGTEPVVLSNYKLRIGNTNYTLPAQTVEPGAYFVQTAATGSWALSNKGNTITLCLASTCATEAAPQDATTWPAAVKAAAWMKDAGGTWAWTAQPTSGSANVLQPPATPKPTPNIPATTPAVIDKDDNDPEASDTTEAAGSTQADGVQGQVVLTELLPDPASPQTDAHHEYIEFFNPGDTAINLAGYVIKTGANLTTKHTLPSLVIEPGAYGQITSDQSHVALTNSGTNLALYDPSGQQVGETITYGAAKAGQAWAWSETGWSWTTTPTPGLANLITVPAPAAGAPKQAKNPGKTAGSATKAAPSSSTGAAQPLVANTSTPSGNWLIWLLVGLTICYCLYEFRHDLFSYYHKLRGYPKPGSGAGPAPEGR
jgi:hypothetical protein